MSNLGMIFGEGDFGTATFGAPLGAGTNLPTYSARPMTAVATSYTGIQINWSFPNAGYQMRLLRNSFSTPADQNDGVTLAQFAYNTGPQNPFTAPQYADVLTADSGGRWMYYALFMLSSAGGGYWQRAGDCQVLLPKNWGYGAAMFAMLPQWYQTLDADMDDPIYVQPSSMQVGWSQSQSWKG